MRATTVTNTVTRRAASDRKRSHSVPPIRRFRTKSVSASKKNFQEICDSKFHDALRACRPLSINLTRLPDSVTGKDNDMLTLDNQKKKRKRTYLWKYGVDNSRKKERTLRRKFDAALKLKRKDKENKEKMATTSNETASEQIFDVPSIMTKEESSEKTTPENASETEAAENPQRNETETQRVPDTQESHTLKMDDVSSDIPNYKESSKDCPPISGCFENLLQPKVIVIPEVTEPNDNRNRNRKRRASQFDIVETSEAQIKKQKLEVYTERFVQENDFVTKKIPSKSKGKHRPKSRPRKKLNPVKLREVNVFMERLEDVEDPLIQRWMEKIAAKYETSDHRSAFAMYLRETENSFQATKDTENILENFDSRISEKYRNGNEEDDEEIVRILSYQRKSRNRILSDSSDESSYHETPTQRLLRSSGKTPLINETWLENNRRKSRSRVRRTTPRISNDSPNSESSSNYGRTRLLRNRARTHTGNFSSLSRLSNYEASSLTRSSSRASVNSIASDSEDRPDSSMSLVIDNRRSRVGKNLSKPVITEDSNSDTNVDINRSKITAKESSSRKQNFKSRDTADTDSEYSISDVVSEARTIESRDSGEGLVARRKLTAFNNAMVVLTRLDTFDNISDENRRYDAEMEFHNVEELSKDSSLSVTTNSRETRPRDPLETRYSQQSEELDFTLAFESRFSQETVDSEDPLFGENYSQASNESDEDFRLVLDENAVTSSETITHSKNCALNNSKLISTSDGILTNANSNNDKNTTSHSRENLNEHCKRCDCDEHQRREQRLNCQNIAATHKCILCRSLFANTETFEQHRTSAGSCSVSRLCTICLTNFSTCAEFMKHRIACERASRRRKSTEQSLKGKTSEDTNETQSSPVPNNKSAKSNQKKPSGGNIVKKGRPKCRRSDNVCSVCSINFASTADLSEHIYKHSTGELQEAYRLAKAKAIAGTTTSEENSSDVSEATIIPTEELNKSANIPENPAEATIQVIETNGTIVNNLLSTVSTTVCPCHKDNLPPQPDKTDLQIEIVLLCQYCQVIFRRRECFEVHYRTSPQCAGDRTQGRWPRFYCANCQSCVNNWTDMRNHLEAHANLNVEGTVRFVCNICRVVFVGFGALYHQHWFAHLKDTTFVASRYSFPKIALQLCDKGAVPPAGATINERYIIVAEHVCPDCKVPYQSSVELQEHQIRESHVEKYKDVSAETRNEVNSNTIETRWYCDCCYITFPDIISLNEHCKVRHCQRYTCVALGPGKKTFACMKCCITRDLVTELEEHWKIHKSTAKNSSVETKTRKSGTIEKESAVQVTSSVTDEIINETSNSAAKRRTVICASKSKPSEELVIRNVLSNERKNQDESSESIAKSGSKIVALDNSLVNVVPSSSKSSSPSVALSLDQSFSTSDENDATDSYQVLLTDNSATGGIKMVLARMNDSSGDARSEQTTEKQPIPDANHFKHSTNKNKDLSSLIATKPLVPEVIEIIEDDEIRETTNNEQTNFNNQESTDSSSSVAKSTGIIETVTIDDPTPGSTIVKGKSRKSKRFNASDDSVIRAAAAAVISFEESRYQYLINTKSLSNLSTDSGYSPGTKKPGFLRVKNLAELQAVKTHVCNVCTAAFESQASLMEHGRLHSGNSSSLESTLPTGMAAVLVLPDSSEIPQQQQRQQQQRPPPPYPTLTRTTYVPQQIYDSRSNNTGGSWVTVAMQNQQSATPLQLANPRQYVAKKKNELQQPLGDNQGMQKRYHTLPAIIGTPSKTAQPAGNLQQISANNTFKEVMNNSLRYYSADPNKYYCNVCQTFQNCTLDSFKDHVVTHFSDTNASVNSNLMQSCIANAPPRYVAPKTGRESTNQKNVSWYLTNTPGGPVWVTPIAPKNPIETHVRRGDPTNLRPVPPISHMLLSNCVVVYRCMMCEVTVCNEFQAIVDHLVNVHKTQRALASALENIIQKMFRCTYCVHTMTEFDTEKKLETHLDLVHSNTCRNCSRVFVSFQLLTTHLRQCPVSRPAIDAFDNN